MRVHIPLIAGSLWVDGSISTVEMGRRIQRVRAAPVTRLKRLRGLDVLQSTHAFCGNQRNATCAVRTARNGLKEVSSLSGKQKVGTLTRPEIHVY